LKIKDRKIKARYRAVAVLKSKPGRGPELIDFTVEVVPQIRRVEGLSKFEVNRSLTEPERLVLYYWWESPEHSRRYVAGPVYASIAPRLAALVEEHQLYMTENLS
jgi:quinol monooxygenase YgiN